MKATMAELTYHCKFCDQRKPAGEMRKDSSYPSGFRPQCLDCKRKVESKRKKATKRTAPANRQAKKKPSSPKPSLKSQSVPFKDRLYPCARCGRDDVPFDEMCKDKRKFAGVASTCRACRRERDRVLQQQAAAEAERRAEEARRLMVDEWEHCYKCNKRSRPGVMRQPPTSLSAGFPEDALLCHSCLGRATSREEMVKAERARFGLGANATRKELESAARVAALRELAQTHEDQYRELMRMFMDRLGVEPSRRWVTL